GEIHACKIDDATIWPSLQFIIANFKDDQGVALVSYLNYIMAIGSYTIQYFYDAGLPPPGVSIAPYLNANVLVGMPDQNAPGQVGFPTFCNIANTVAFFGQTTNRDLGIFILNGMTPQKVSTSWIDKIFDVYLAGKSPRVWATSGGTGHEFVIVDVFSNAYVLVYDMTTKEWTYWQTHTQAGDGGFRYCNSLLVDPLFGGNIWVGTFDSNLYLVSPNYYWDGGETFSMMVQTGKIDGGTMQKKFCGIADFVADQNPSNVSIGWFDDDYQTLQGGSNINLNGTRPRMNRLGSFRRRAFRIYANDSAPARWEALELTVSAGES
ncbi:MAG: hypothetical protein ACREQO_27595, partial [Candidatus Binatia bacterium]